MSPYDENWLNETEVREDRATIIRKHLGWPISGIPDIHQQAKKMKEDRNERQSRS